MTGSRLAAYLDTTLRHWAETAPYRAARLVGLPLWSYREKNVAGFIDGAYIHLAAGGWVRVREVSPGEFEQACSAPPPLSFGSAFLPAPLMAATDLAAVTAGVNDNHIYVASMDTYANVRAATAGALGTIDATNWRVGQRFYVVGGVDEYYRIDRAQVPFDTSGLPDTCGITAAHAHLTVESAGCVVHQVSSGGSNPLVSGDYDLFGAVSRGSADCTSTGAKVLTLTDFSDISKTAVSLLGFRSANDLNNIAPESNEFTLISSADHATAGNRPVLDVSYILIVTSDLTLQWDIGGTVTSDSTLKWDIGGTVTSDLTLEWDTYGGWYFLEPPSWQENVGPRRTKARVLIEGGAIYTAATGGVAAADHVDAPLVTVPATTTAGEAQAAADARLAAYAGRAVSIGGPVEMCVLIGFDDEVRVQYTIRGRDGAGVETYTAVETEEVRVTRIVHDVDAMATTFDLGDDSPQDTEAIVSAIVAGRG